ncbi:hypothetical protein [Williamsia maris]|uniref:Uncharacterized protein n=1 Tax=Williamsia maris TaxID=72806 RepID=A0ABT1HGS8_9NOCA|nr:hypothetical protein [Williamsia maris]MCP2177443.1 hypothetical protein [Williamsia maris]
MSPAFDETPELDAPEPEAPATDEFPAVTPPRGRRSVGVGVLRAVSGLTVLAVVVAATWYADAGRTQVAVTVPVAADRAAAAVAPVTPGPAGPAVAQPKPTAPEASAPEASAPAAPAADAPAAAVAISPGAGVTLPGTPAAPGASPATPITPGATGSSPGGSVAINGNGTGGAAAGFATAPIAEQPACPGIPKPDRSGGLSSIVELAPMFGSFSSEVFALGPAMQPALQLFGPVLAELEPVIHQNLPWITPILNRISDATAVILKAILPFYGPYREQFISAEGQFAASLTPVLTKIYQSPAAACLVALEGQIIRNAKGKPIHTPSLSRPGQVNVLRPRA